MFVTDNFSCFVIHVLATSEETRDNYSKHHYYFFEKKIEVEVMEVVPLLPKDKKGFRCEVLIRRGNHNHNICILRENKENLIVVMKTTSNKKQVSWYYGVKYLIQEKKCFNNKTNAIDCKYSVKFNRGFSAAEEMGTIRIFTV